MLERPRGSGGISKRGTQNVLGLTQRGTKGTVPRSLRQPQKQEEGGRGKSRRGGGSTKQRGGFPQELGRRVVHIPLGLLLATKQGRATSCEMDVDVVVVVVGSKSEAKV